jgi:Domain of unknown function (DUF4157)
MEIIRPGDPLEREADAIAEQAIQTQEGSLDGASTVLARSPSGPSAMGAVFRSVGASVGAYPQGTAAPIVGNVLRSAGTPLDQATRQDFESRLDHDFGGVRVHTGTQAAESARALGAAAYTVGRDIVFGEGRFAPNTQAGRRLLAHELTHVTQQNGPNTLARQTVNTNAGGLPTPTSVQVVVISGATNDITFYTNQGALRYQLTLFNVSEGEYDAAVTVKGKNVAFDLGENAPEGVRFRFQYKVEPGQVDPSQLFAVQSQVHIVVRAAGSGSPTNPSVAKLPAGNYVDSFSEVIYDLDYNRQGTSLSTWLRVRYADGPTIDINIYSLEETKMSSLEARDAMAQGYVGQGGRIFPLRMNAQTTPRLWAARGAALEEMEKSNIDFMKLALAGVLVVITLPAMPAGMAPEGVGGAPRPMVSRVPRPPGGSLPPVVEELPPVELPTEQAPGQVPETVAAPEGSPAGNQPPVATEIPQPLIEPLNGKVNVGGGLEQGAADATNLNPIKPGSGGPSRGIPNHVKAPFEDIDKVFKPGSAKQIFSNRLRYVDVTDWTRAAQGSAKVIANGGKLHLNVWTSSSAETQVVIDAFAGAGFKNVRAIGSGPGTLIIGTF